MSKHAYISVENGDYSVCGYPAVNANLIVPWDHLAHMVSSGTIPYDLRNAMRDAVSRRVYQMDEPTLCHAPVEHVKDAARTLAKEGLKIAAIKLLRAETGASLKEAKEYADWLQVS